MIINVLADFTIGFIFIILGSFVLFHNHRNILNKLYAIFSFCCGLTPILENINYLIFEHCQRYFITLANIKLLVLLIGIIFFVLLILHFPERKSLIKSKLLFIFFLPVIYTLNILLFSSFYSSYRIEKQIIKERNIFFVIYSLILVIYLVFSFGLMIQKTITAKNSIHKKQLFLFFLGTGICFILFVFDGFFHLSSESGMIRAINGFHTGPFIFCFFSFYSIIRYQSFSIKSSFLHDQEKEARTQFFINLAHETKTPLTLIDYYLEKFRRSRRECDLQVVSQNIKKLTRMMTNFLDIQKLERGQLIYNHDQIVDLSHVVASIADLFAESALKKSIRLRKTIAPGIYVKADSMAVDRIINNLLDNAVKFTPARGQIIVELSKGKQITRLSVRDTGPGIEEDPITAIFEPYYQSAKKKSNLQGIGMGLNITQSIVMELHGSISVQNNENEGALFTVILPVYTLKESDTPLKQIDLTQGTGTVPVMQLRPSPVKAGRFNLLVVEDNIDLLASLQAELEDEYNFHYVLDGLQALELLQKFRPHLIISDIMMDKMDGLELVKNLPPQCKDIPFIFVTAKTTKQDKLNGLMQGAVDYLCKPFDMDELKARIKALLEQNKARQTILGQRLVHALCYDDQLKGLIPGQSQPDPMTSRLRQLAKQYKLTEREQEVITQFIEYDDPLHISEKLYISPNTVKTHLKNIYRKLDINKKSQLFRLLHLN